MQKLRSQEALGRSLQTTDHHHNDGDADVADAWWREQVTFCSKHVMVGTKEASGKHMT